jgi:hypothetical protein
MDPCARWPWVDNIVSRPRNLPGITMNHLSKCLASAVFLIAALPAMAASTATSSASDSSTTSVGSVSGSIQKSSAASSKPPTPLLAGDYRVVEVTALAERPGTLRLTLQSLTDASADGEFQLFVPQQALDRSALSQGQIISARERSYGIEFSVAATKEAFFLVLADDWYRELQSNAVVL